MPTLSFGRSAASCRDAGYLERLRDYYAENKRIPPYSRLAELLGFASKTAAMKLLGRLAEQGYIERTADDDAWIPSRRFFERPLATQTVPAGQPVGVQEAGADTLLVDDYLIRQPSRTVLVPIRGDSMSDAGIHDGDVAVVERGRPAQEGDFVIAIVDNEFTLKELRLERGTPCLHPHNKAYPVIRPRGTLEIYGVLVGLMRRYSS
jgi:repressor LexA